MTHELTRSEAIELIDVAIALDKTFGIENEHGVTVDKQFDGWAMNVTYTNTGDTQPFRVMAPDEYASEFFVATGNNLDQRDFRQTERYVAECSYIGGMPNNGLIIRGIITLEGLQDLMRTDTQPTTVKQEYTDLFSGSRCMDDRRVF